MHWHVGTGVASVCWRTGVACRDSALRHIGTLLAHWCSVSAHWHTGSRACTCVGVWVRVHRRGRQHNLSLGAKNNDRVCGGNSRGIEARPRCGVSRNQGDLPWAKARNLQVNRDT